MSRLIVKNLPKKITDTELRAHFASHGQVTDCCLKYTPDGRFRQFAFVGYANETDAMNAKQFYDRTFIGSNRLEVRASRRAHAHYALRWTFVNRLPPQISRVHGVEMQTTRTSRRVMTARNGHRRTQNKMRVKYTSLQMRPISRS
jgi:RNA recognition motif-containing protein